MTSPYVENNYYNNLRVAYPNSLGGYTLGLAPLGVNGYNNVYNPYNVYPNSNGTYSLGLTAPTITGSVNAALDGYNGGAVGVANLAYGNPYALGVTSLANGELYNAAYYYNELRYRGLRY